MLSGFVVVWICWLRGLLGLNAFSVQIVDPKLASYGVENPIFAVIQLAQTTMRSELGKITLDKTFEERDTLNEKIVVRLFSLSCFYSFVCESTLACAFLFKFSVLLFYD